MNTEASNGQTRPMGAVLELTSDLACVRLSLVNAYLYGPRGGADRSWVLVDAGLKTSTRAIVRAAEARFGKKSRPAAIVLTHGHFDHVGALKRLAELWDVPVYAHELELPYLTGKSRYLPPDPSVGGGAMARLSPLYPRGPIDVSGWIRPLPAGGTVPPMPGWQWVHTPGHTVGHVAFFRESDRTLIAGDAFVTTKQESMLDALFFQQPHVRRPPAYYTPDWVAARASCERLLQLQPHLAGTGHGIPMYGAALLRQLEGLVREWDLLAVPRKGKYVALEGHA